MAFDSLMPQPSMNIIADVYGQTALDLSRLAASETRCKLDIAYGDGPWRTLDMYLPPADGKNLPVFMNFHGGGFTHGYKEWMGLNAPPLVDLPAIYLSVSYELNRRDQIDIPLGDALTALAWVHANIAKYGGSPDRIFVGGHSAGAMLSSLLTLRKDLYKQYKLPADVIKACFPVSGTYDLQHGDVYGQDSVSSYKVPERREAAAALSAIRYVRGNKTPFFVTWGENDAELTRATASAFILALREAGARTEAHMFPMFDHFWMHIDQQQGGNLWNRVIRAWMTGDPRTTAIPAK